MECETLIVSNASHAECNGRYTYVSNVTVSFAPGHPVYHNVEKNRYIFWNGKQGWAISGEGGLLEGGSSYSSKHKIVSFNDPKITSPYKY